MNMCTHQTLAIRVVERTLTMIAALNGGVEPSIERYPTYFMIYCVDSCHEESAIIDESTFNRTYGAMPGHVLSSYVTTID